jgi:NADH-quinone oxidoreductase subunit N
MKARALGLAAIGLVTSVLGAYYYLRVVVYMYMRPAEGEPEEALRSSSVAIALAAAVAVVVLLGVAAEPLVRLAQSSGAFRL